VSRKVFARAALAAVSKSPWRGPTIFSVNVGHSQRSFQGEDASRRGKHTSIHRDDQFQSFFLGANLLKTLCGTYAIPDFTKSLIGSTW
jgi:hypothetical protein